MIRRQFCRNVKPFLKEQVVAMMGSRDCSDEIN